MASQQPGSSVSGNYQVKAIRSARTAAHRLFPRIAHCMELRAQALKLRYWPARNPTDNAGRLLDLNWEWVKSLKNDGIGELRIEGTIGGRDNLRLIFLVPKKRTHGSRPVIWIVHVMQKKRQAFTGSELSVFSARAALVLARFYGGRT